MSSLEEPPTTPPPINDSDIANAVNALKFVESDEPVPDSLRKSLYYPLQTIPLPSFQRDMLLWTEDKLKLFHGNSSGIPLEFSKPESIKEVPSLSRITPLPRYRRKDDFCVLAVVPLGVETCVVFSNEVSQVSWEVVGVFGLHFRNKLLASTPGLVDSYEEIEENYHPTHGTAKQSEEDHYWNRYAADEPMESANQQSHEIIRRERELSKQGNDDLAALNDDNDYWDRLANQPHQITNGEEGEVVVRNDIVKLLTNLAELYIDLGVPNKKLIIDDIMGIAMGAQSRMQIGVPLVAHRHAIRTVRWLTKDGIDISAEASAAISKIERY